MKYECTARMLYVVVCNTLVRVTGCVRYVHSDRFHQNPTQIPLRIPSTLEFLRILFLTGFLSILNIMPVEWLKR